MTQAGTNKFRNGPVPIITLWGDEEIESDMS